MSLISSEDKKMREPKYFIELRPEMKPAKSRNERSLNAALICCAVMVVIALLGYWLS